MKVYYSEKMVAESESFSPSASKPQKVIEDWIDRGLDVEVIEPIALSRQDIALAHDIGYVNSVLDCKTPNGFGNTSKDVARSLQYTTASMYWAAKTALKDNSQVAALCSGFHHASHNHGGGFCTFNGLMIALLKLYKEKKVRKAGILDLDNHYGDGTDNIIKKLRIKWIKHFTGGRNYHSPVQAEEFLKRLPEIVESFKGVDVLLVQCGADPYINDSLGGWLTIEQLKRRDKIIFEVCRNLNIPVCWNLAGGYSFDKNGGISKVLEIHRNTAMECIEASEKIKEAM